MGDFFNPSNTEAQFYIKYKFGFHSFAINRADTDVYQLSYTQTHSSNLVQRSRKWSDAVLGFKAWCERLVEELNTVTGWEGLDNVRIFGGLSSDIDDPISVDEKIFYREALVFIAEEIQSLQILTEEQSGILNQKLNELSSKVDHLSRFDWQGQFLGLVANVILFFGQRQPGHYGLPFKMPSRH